MRIFYAIYNHVMAYPVHNRLVVMGDFYLAGTLETWQFTLNTHGALMTAPIRGEENTDLETAIKTWWTAMQSTVNPLCDQVRLTGFKYNAIGTDGHYETPEEPNTVTWTPVAGTNTGPPVFPPQCAWVVSLRTGFSGKSYNGRIYIPFIMGAAFLSDGFAISSSYTDAMSGVMKHFLDDLNAVYAEHSGGRVSVVSSKGFSNPVTAVRVGNRIDTQRRRRRGLVETYATEDALT